MKWSRSTSSQAAGACLRLFQGGFLVLLLFGCMRSVNAASANLSEHLIFSNLGFHGELDCQEAFLGRSQSTGAKIHAGLLHPHGPCSPMKKLSHTGDLPGLAVEILKRDEHRFRSVQSRVQPSKLYDTSLASSSSSFAEGPVVSGNSLGSGNYILKVGLGTPSRQLLLMLDTGSDLAWTQCLPCASSACYPQVDPIFDPTTSSSYIKASCLSDTCTLVGSTAGCSFDNVCQYRIRYADNSSTTGDVASDTLTIGNVTLHDYTFGCGHENQGLFQGVDGLLGLGLGALALPAQTRASLGGVFAYCLPNILSTTSKSGFIELGMEAATASRSNSLFTPIIKNLAAPSFYFVWLTEISLGGLPLPLSSIPSTPPTLTAQGGTIVDSGTVITRLPAADYAILRDAFVASTINLTPVNPPPGIFFDTCFNLSAASTSSRIDLVTFHFFNGLDLTLPVENMLYPVDNAGTACLAFAPSSGLFNIIGNFQMQGFLFTFDTVVSAMGIQTKTKAC